MRKVAPGNPKPAPITPSVSDPDSAGRILDAAERLFAQQGFKATTTQQIAQASGRNAALVHYYFTNKESLYKAVLRRVAERFATEIASQLPVTSTPDEAIRSLVRAQLGVLRARPHILGLMVREMADWGASHAEDAIQIIAATVFERVCSIIKAGQREGHFRADVDPRFAAISLVAQMNWVFLARPAIGVLMGRGLGKLADDDLNAFASHASEFVIAALRNPDRRGTTADTSTPARP